MKPSITILTLVISLFLANTLHAQVLEKKAFKDATTIRFYVNDPTETAAIARFTDFINKTSWTVQSPSKMTEEAKRDSLFNPDAIKIFPSPHPSPFGEGGKTAQGRLSKG